MEGFKIKGCQSGEISPNLVTLPHHRSSYSNLKFFYDFDSQASFYFKR